MQESGGIVACLAGGRVFVYHLESLARYKVQKELHVTCLLFWKGWKAFCSSLLKPGIEER